MKANKAAINLFLIIVLIAFPASVFADEAPVGNVPVRIRNLQKVITLIDTSQTTSFVVVGKTLKLSATVNNTSGQAQRILVDMEIHDSKQKKVASKVFDNVVIKKDGSVTFVMSSPKSLKTGVYTLEVGVFTPGWKDLLHWYYGLEAFNVYGKQNTVVSVISVDGAEGYYTRGQNNQITANLVSRGGDTNLVNVQVLLLNQKNQVVASNTYKNQFLIRNDETPFSLDISPRLPSGVYRIALKIFNPEGTLKLNNNLGLITVQ